MIAKAPSQMGCAESGRIFQAKTQKPVGGDMRGPNQGRPVKPRHGERKTGGGQQRRRQKSVAEIVNQGAPARAEEIAGHGQIGREKKHGEQRPASAQMAMGQARQDQDKRALGAQIP